MSDRRRRERVPLIALLLCVAYGILFAAWVTTNPPFAAPDETEHYIRAVGLSRGDVFGAPTTVTVPAGATAEQRAYLQRAASHFRTVALPARMFGSNLVCDALRLERSASCLENVVLTTRTTRQQTVMTHYEPGGYLPAAATVRLGSNVFSALRLARIAQALAVFLLIAAAIAMLAAPAGLISVVGIVVATTPMVVFVGASLNPSGLEIGGGIAFAAALLRLARPEPPRSAWALAGIAGATLALSRSPGPAWVLADVAIVTLLVGLAGGRRIVASRPRRAGVAGAVVATGVIAGLAWSVAVGPQSSANPASVLRALKHATALLPELFTQEVGRFGWLDSPIPTLATLSWEALVVAIVAAAFVVGTVRERRALAAATAAALAVPVLFSAWYEAVTRVGAQGRHVLPLAVMAPMLAGEILYRNRGRLADLNALWLAAPVPIVAVAIHGVAWYWNGRRHAVGTDGPRLFITDAEWSPPGGWVVWTLLVFVGLSALSATAFVGRARINPKAPT